MDGPELRRALQRILSADGMSAVPTGTPVSGLWIFAAAAVATVLGEVFGTLVALDFALPPEATSDIMKLSSWACGFGVLLALASASHLWFGLLAAVACYRSGMLFVPIASHGALNYLVLRGG